jgi:hypothetical protein
MLVNMVNLDTQIEVLLPITNDIVIRSTNINTPNGVRLLAEFDVLDGGVY